MNSDTAGNKTRLDNLDLLKAVAIICMIICHAVIRLGEHHAGYENDFAFWFGDVVLGSYIAVAHAFMFSMGVTLHFGSHYSSKSLIKRGFYLLLVAYVLNFFRYTIYCLIDGFIQGEFMEDTLYSFLCQDILHFAGLALILTGIFRKLKMKEWHILIAGIVMSLIGGFLALKYDRGAVSNYLLGFFIVTDTTWSCFSLFNWYFFVAFGLWFGKILKNVSDLKTFYRRIFAVSSVIAAVYTALSFRIGYYPFTPEKWYYATTLPEDIGYLSIDLVMLSAFFLMGLSSRSNKVVKVLCDMSSRLLRVYCAQWCLIGFIESVFCFLLEIVFSYPVIYVIGILLIPLSYLTAIAADKIMMRAAGRKGTKMIKRAE